MSTPLPSTADRAGPIAWRIFVGACRLAVGGMFLFAAITKIVDLAGFEDRLLTQSPLPSTIASVVARILPWLE
ncbi:MAG TPA: MauE/DoxX family redox-associated membrane protein, partial [Gemmataceae bacterium]|nr:MauE/DoxX family redox-associated membrane protein [Gemmataceae bacterium]